MIWRHWSSLLAGMGLIAVGLSGCGDNDSDGETEAQTETVEIFMWDAPQFSTTLRQHIEQFEQQSDIDIEVQWVQEFGGIFDTIEQQAAQGGADFDLFFGSNIWIGDLVSLGFIDPLDTFIEADKDNDELAWDDVPEGLRRKNSWGGNTYSFIVDNDNQFLFYRKDIFNDSAVNTAYESWSGNPAGDPLEVPETIDELIQVATFFQEEIEGGGLANYTDIEHSFVTNLRQGDQAYWYAYNFVAPYTVTPTSEAPAQGVMLFEPDMTPLVNTPGFIKGVEKWEEIIECCVDQTVIDESEDGDYNENGSTDEDPYYKLGRNAVRDLMVEGKAVMAIDWGDIGPASVGDNSAVKGKIGFALPPGTTEYYNWQDDEWVEDLTDVHRAPVHQFNGWAWYMTANSDNKQAAWEFLRFLASPEVSRKDVADPAGGYQPWRTSHSTDLSNFEASGWATADAEDYVETILANTNHPNAVFDLRIPGGADYGDTLAGHLMSIIGTPDAPDTHTEVSTAMSACEADLDTITDDKGREPQERAYKSHLGIENN